TVAVSSGPTFGVLVGLGGCVSIGSATDSDVGLGGSVGAFVEVGRGVSVGAVVAVGGGTVGVSLGGTRVAVGAVVALGAGVGVGAIGVAVGSALTSQPQNA